MSQNDASDFVDSDFQSVQKTTYVAPAAELRVSPALSSNRPPTREEIESLVSEKQIKLAELKRAQEELERERAGLEELRRRQMEFQTGREEMLQNLTRGMGLLEEAELGTRRDADAMARTLAEFRDALAKVQAINEQTWTADKFTVELTRALTTLENARMEWNSARVKFPILSGAGSEEGEGPLTASALGQKSMWELCKLGLALTWPLVLLGSALLLILLFRH